jgi:hypothetical protein
MMIVSTPMTNKLFNIFHSDADNIGDYMCGPSQYLWPTKFANFPLSSRLPENIDGAIVGGGQIFSQLQSIANHVSRNTDPTKLVGWGVGLPLRGTNDSSVGKVAKAFSAFSTRNYDWRGALDFVPCASCLSSAFEKRTDPQYEIIVFRHRRKPGPVNVPPSIPSMSNSMNDPQAVIDFIASGETVVTSSYHGVYWAQLLGRKVLCIPYNHKFFTFENLPTFAEPETWLAQLKYVKRIRPLLEEYRILNQDFAQKVEKIWHG